MAARRLAVPIERSPGRESGLKEFSAKRLEKAGRATDAARRELDAGAAEFAAGHAYFAMFYAPEALLADRGLGYSKHGQVHGAFGREFARTAGMDPKYHRWLLDAFKVRQRATYGVDAPIAVAEAGEMINRADDFVAAARRYLEALS